MIQKRRPSVLAVTDRVGENLTNGAQVFADALLCELAKWLNLTVLVHTCSTQAHDRPFVVLESTTVLPKESLVDWLARSLRGVQPDLIYNLGATSFACKVSAILVERYPDADLVNHFQVNLASYAKQEGSTDEQICELANIQHEVAIRARRNVFPSFAEMTIAPRDAAIDRSCVIVNPFIDAGAPLGRRPQRPFTFLAAGRFSDYVKGADLLFRAFSSLHRQHPDVRLETAVDHPRFSELLDSASAAACTHHGWLNRESLHCAMRDADVVIVPSRYEPFGLVALEAMAMGTTVIAMGVGGLGEIVHHNETGWLTRPEDGSLGLRSTMERAVAERSLAHKMGRKARTIARTEYALARVVRQVRALLENTLSERDPRTHGFATHPQASY